MDILTWEQRMSVQGSEAGKRSKKKGMVYTPFLSKAVQLQPFDRFWRRLNRDTHVKKYVPVYGDVYFQQVQSCVETSVKLWHPIRREAPAVSHHSSQDVWRHAGHLISPLIREVDDSCWQCRRPAALSVDSGCVCGSKSADSFISLLSGRQDCLNFKTWDVVSAC